MIRISLAVSTAIAIGLGGCRADRAPDADGRPIPVPATRPSTTRAAAAPASAEPDATVLFDGRTLKNWKSTEFGGEGQVRVEDGQIVVGSGASLSGVTWAGGQLPVVNYEIELDAKKIDGSDFFLALTFPYKKDHATFVLGGWGGSLVGLSNINDNDAANNDAQSIGDFKRNQWYHVRLRATDDKIQGWIGDAHDPVLDVETKDKKISTRADIDLAKPLGLSTYTTSAAYKNIKLRKL